MNKHEIPLDSINFTEGKFVIINMGSHPEKTQEIIRALCLLTDQERLKEVGVTEVFEMATRARDLISERLKICTGLNGKKPPLLKTTYEHLDEFLGRLQRQNREIKSITGKSMGVFPERMLVALESRSNEPFRQTLTDITGIDCSEGRIFLSDELV